MKNKRGFVPVIIAVVVVAVVGVGSYFFIQKGKQEGKGTSLQSSQKRESGNNENRGANCALNDSVLCAYMNKSSRMTDAFKTGFAGTTTITDKSGRKSENIWEITGDRTHFMTYANGKEESNMIMIGDTTYTKDMSDGKWTKFTFKTEDKKEGKGLFDIDQMKEQFKDTIKETEDKTTYKAMGKEACGKLQCFKYEIQNPLTTDSKEFLYFDDREYMMRKIRIEGKDGTITETLYEFKNIIISEPSPIKADTGNWGIKGDTGTSEVDVQELLKKIQITQGAQEPEESSEEVSE